MVGKTYLRLTGVGRKSILWGAAACILLILLPSGLLPGQTKDKVPAAASDAWNTRFAKEASIWKRYGSSLRAGKLENAEQTFKELEYSFKTESDRADFWSQVLPDNQRHTIRFLRVCDSCTGGECPVCHGSGTCLVCKGDKKCQVCKGLGVKRTACAKCLCPECRGTGFCTKCLGQKSFPCKKCSGHGSIQESESLPCKRCAGTGKVVGGIANDLQRPCPDCGGKGVVETKKKTECPDCLGKKYLQCAACGGSGRCPSCQGKKRTGGCTECNDTGTIVTKCVNCLGTGKCPACANKPVCVKCGGTGRCPSCDGTTVLYERSLPADPEWLSHPSSCVVQDAAKYMMDGQSLAAAGAGSPVGVVELEQIGKLSRGKTPLKLAPRRGETVCISETDATQWLPGPFFK